MSMLKLCIRERLWEVKSIRARFLSDFLRDGGMIVLRNCLLAVI